MKCPKCGFVSHDYLDACRKCSIDLADFKTQMNLRVVQPGVIDLMAALDGAAVGLKAKADMFGSQMLVESDETLDESGDNFDISLDDDFSAFDSDQLENIRSGEPASAGTEVAFDLSDQSDTTSADNDPSLPPPTTGYATVMIDVSSMEAMFGDDNDDNKDSGAAATEQSDEPPAMPEEISPDLVLDTADTVSPNTAMLGLEGLNEPPDTADLDDMNKADTAVLDIDDALDPDATIADPMAASDGPTFEDAASLEHDDAAATLEAEPISPSKDIALPHTVERTMVLGDLDAFESPAPIDATDEATAIDNFDIPTVEDTMVDAEISDLDIPAMDMPPMDMPPMDMPDDMDVPDIDIADVSEIEAPTPTTVSFTQTEIDLEPDEASAANPTAALEVPESTSATELDLSDLDFDLEPDLLSFDAQNTEDLDINFMSTEAPQPPMPQAQDADEMPLDLDDFDLEDDEQSSI